MPAPKIHEHWYKRVIHYLAEDHSAERRSSPTAINRSLVAEATEMSKTMRAKVGNAPSPRYIDRIRVRDWEPKPLEEKIEYHNFSWPESMERIDLPWEAAAAALELLAYKRDIPDEPPTNQEALWFWRVTQAAPNAPLLFRYRLSIILAWRPAMGYQIPPGLGMVLAHAGSYRQSNLGADIPSMDDLDECIQIWLGFADIDGHGPDPEITVYFGQDAKEFLAAREALKDTEDQNE